jgi:hypothetical protein
MAVAPLLFPQQQAYSDATGLFKSLASLGKVTTPQDNLGDLGTLYGAPTTPPTAPPSSGSNYSKAISGIESGGRYDALGPATQGGDRAYGKYQVMGANIPEWSKAALGYAMTPEQFLADPQAQEKIFNHRFGQYVDKYGPTGAAKAWFAGEGGMKNPNASDVYGTTVQSYADKFNRALDQ